MFTIGDKEYDLKFNTTRCKLIEKAIGKSVVAALALTNDYQMSLSDIDAMFRYALKETGSDVFVMPKYASELCDRYLEEHGYMDTVALIIKTLVSDMGFLFRQA